MGLTNTETMPFNHANPAQYNTDAYISEAIPVLLPVLIENIMNTLKDNKTLIYAKAENIYFTNIRHALQNLTIRAIDVPYYQQIHSEDVITYQTLLAQLRQMSESSELTSKLKNAIKTVLQQIESYVEACHPNLYQESKNTSVPLPKTNPLCDLKAPSAPPSYNELNVGSSSQVRTFALFNPFMKVSMIAQLEQSTHRIKEGFIEPASADISSLQETIDGLYIDENHPKKIMRFLHKIKTNMNTIQTDPDRKTNEASFFKALDRLYDRVLAYALKASPAFEKRHTEIVDSLATASRFVSNKNCQGYLCSALFPFSLLYCGCCCELGCFVDTCPQKLPTININTYSTLKRADSVGADVELISGTKTKFKKVVYTTKVYGEYCGSHIVTRERSV